MSKLETSIEIYLEVGQKKTFATAVDWPGWSRSAKDEESAVQTLLDYGPRYAEIPKAAGIAFQPPESASSFNIVDRLEGNTTTDFGAPDMPLPDDWDPVGKQELERMKGILRACWHVFDQAIEKGEGKELQKGPRGGGRDLEKIVEHVVGAEIGYLKRLGWKPNVGKGDTLEKRMLQVREEVLRGLEAAADGQFPREGPRGGKRWSPRFFVRRLAWHVVDHAWEIEDRILD